MSGVFGDCWKIDPSQGTRLIGLQKMMWPPGSYFELCTWSLLSSIACKFR